ncbi:hypothetical protein C8Q79DRAFT_925852 [Trametes meyenii]|nr:hypothetical protein C8Q79DRAFT_925852 [Trametes meyenii]
MKAYFVFLAFVGSALAQSITIFSPSADTTVTAGNSLVVDIERKPGLSGPSSVSVVIGLKPCGTLGCRALSVPSGVGTPVFMGGFNPQSVPGSGSTARFQNFTIQVPPTFPKGQALLTVAHFFLGGVGTMIFEKAALAPGFETVDTAIIIQ